MKTPHDFSTTYLGLPLCSPLVPSASPLSEHLDGLLEMERCGAGAVVLHSLFEEPYQPEPHHIDRYLDEVIIAKRHLRIPVIASLSASTPQGWVRLAEKLEKAGADALELNVCHLNLAADTPSAQIEESYRTTVRSVVAVTKIPVAVKLPPYFTNLALMTRHLEDAGARGLVFFNRLYQPDLDLLSMGPGYSLRLSTAAENRLPMRWISLLYNQTRLDLAASTGIRTGGDALKMILSGASAVQLCSVLLQRGIPWLESVQQELAQWMDACQVNSLQKARGLLARHAREVPGEIEREEYRRALQGYSLLEVPDWRDEIPLHLPSTRKPSKSPRSASVEAFP